MGLSSQQRNYLAPRYTPHMPRDPGLEELVKSSARQHPRPLRKIHVRRLGISAPRQSALGARRGSLLLRVGKDNEAWANEIPGVATAIMRGRSMSGWVRVTTEVYSDDALRQKLIAAAVQFTGSLPKKNKQP